MEEDAFTKTECYHYFHCACLLRYIEHSLNELDEARREAEKNRQLAKEDKGVSAPQGTANSKSSLVDTLLTFMWHSTLLCWYQNTDVIFKNRLYLGVKTTDNSNYSVIPEFNGCLAKLLFKLSHGWVITFLNSLAPGGFENIFQNVFFKLISWIDTLSNSCETALRSMPQNPSDDKSTLVQVMAWCRQAASHYLSQCCPKSLSPYGVTRPQWVNPWSAGNAWLYTQHCGYWWLVLKHQAIGMHSPH